MMLLLGALAWPALAQAQEPAQAETSAAEDYARGAQLYNEGRNREALEAFNSAIKKANEPVYLCNRAVVLITLEEYDRAIEDLRVCRDTYEMPEASRAQIDAQLKALELFEQTLRPRARDVAGLIANPPKQQDSGREPDGAITPPEVTEPSTLTPRRSLGWVMFGLGTGALVGMGAVEFVNRDAVARYKSVCLGDGPQPEDLDMCRVSQDTLSNQRLLARTLLVSGSVLAITGGVLLWSSRERSPSSSSLRLVPAAQGGKVLWTTRF